MNRRTGLRTLSATALVAVIATLSACAPSTGPDSPVSPGPVGDSGWLWEGSDATATDTSVLIHLDLPSDKVESLPRYAEGVVGQGNGTVTVTKIVGNRAIVCESSALLSMEGDGLTFQQVKDASGQIKPISYVSGKRSVRIDGNALYMSIYIPQASEDDTAEPDSEQKFISVPDAAYEGRLKGIDQVPGTCY